MYTIITGKDTVIENTYKQDCILNISYIYIYIYI